MKRYNKEKIVYEVFQSIAGGYDAANRRISVGLHLRWKRCALEMFCRRLPAEPDILDVGCGTGDILRLLGDAKPESSLTGLDFSPNMLKITKRRCRHAMSLRLVRGNAMNLPFQDETFDGVTISFALRNTTDYRIVLKEMYRVVRPGGVILIIDSFVPRNKLVQPFYRLYFEGIMPALGGGKRYRRQYDWLSVSTREFISAKKLRCLVSRTGFVNLQSGSFMFGACECVIGEKKGV